MAALLVVAVAILLLGIYFASVSFLNSTPFLNLCCESSGKHQFRAYNSASRIIGTCHFLVVVPGSAYALWNTYPWLYSSVNSDLETFIMQISFAYFLADFYHFWFYERDDIPLLLHHMTCILFFAHVLGLGCGGQAAMVAILTGEVTNPLQSAWFLSRQAENHALTAKLSPVFTAAFTGVRIIILPVWCFDVCRGLIGGVGRGDLGPVVAAWWIFMMVCMVLGSVFWTYKILLGFKSYTKKTATAKHS
jgi:hypothetical protein